ncbi:MAG: ferredoxin family protein [Fibrobacterota bacterium]
MAKGKIEIDINYCKGCELCITACKFDVIELSDADKVNPYGYRYLVAAKPGNCTGCGFCGQMCPDSAITVWREIHG